MKHDMYLFYHRGLYKWILNFCLHQQMPVPCFYRYTKSLSYSHSTSSLPNSKGTSLINVPVPYLGLS